MASADDTVNALMDNFRARLPGAPDPAIQLELFNTVDEVAREALRADPPEDVDADPATWLTSAQYIAHYQTILNGTLSRLYAQTMKPWTNADNAKVHADRYAAYLDLSRSEAADSPATIYARIISNLKTTIPIARDATFRIEYYNAADKIRTEALRIDPLDATFTDPAAYIPAANLADAYQALLACTLWRMYSQADKPWYNAEQAAVQYKLYTDELEALRGLNASTPTDIYGRVLDEARVGLPTARDEIIKLALWRVMTEFLRDTQVWLEEIDFNVSVANVAAGKVRYEVDPDSRATIATLVSLLNSDECEVACTMVEPGVIVLKNAPSQADTLTVTYALTPYGTAQSNSYPPDIPQWIIEKYHNEIVDGLLGHMMLQPSKPYSNPQLAAYHARRFRDGIAQARSYQRHDNLFNAQRWAFPQQFATRRRARW